MSDTPGVEDLLYCESACEVRDCLGQLMNANTYAIYASIEAKSRMSNAELELVLDYRARLARLPLLHRELLRLAGSDCTQQEIADYLGVSLRTATRWVADYGIGFTGHAGQPHAKRARNHRKLFLVGKSDGVREAAVPRH